MIKLGIIGTGKMAQEAMEVLRSLGAEIDLQIGAIYGRRLEVVEDLAAKFQIPASYTDYQALLAKADVDTVYIAVPNMLHFQFCKEALLQGKHVICEKPFTNTLAELEELHTIAKAKQVFLLEAITTCHLPGVEKMKECILNQLGDIQLARLNFSQYSSRYDEFLAGEIAPVFDPALKGGVLRDLNIYNIHFLCYVFGKPLAVHYFPVLRKGIDLSGTLILSYGSFQAVAMASKASASDLAVEIQGDKGSLIAVEPINFPHEFTFKPIKGLPHTFGDTKAQSRLIPEFISLLGIIESGDFSRSEALMDHSKLVMAVLEEAAKQLEV